MADDVRPNRQSFYGQHGYPPANVPPPDVTGYVHIPEDNPANRSPSIPKAVESVDGMGRKVITIACFTCGRPTRSDAAMSSFMYIRCLIYCGWCSPRCEVSYHRAWRSNLQGGAFVDGQQPV